MLCHETCFSMLSLMQQTIFSVLSSTAQQSGAEEACWAHNPEVRGSKPRSAISLLCIFTFCEINADDFV
ncbi:hypothetical protein T11_17790, partial [Trichinella zimbabwensis]